MESLEPRLLLDGEPIISEFMTDNDGGLQDWEGDCPDWIEIHNPGTEEVLLTNWRLEDDGNTWTFPPGTTLGPGEFLVVFASGKADRDPPDPLPPLRRDLRPAREGGTLRNGQPQCPPSPRRGGGQGERSDILPASALVPHMTAYGRR